jgi:hypothetical protein
MEWGPCVGSTSLCLGVVSLLCSVSVLIIFLTPHMTNNKRRERQQNNLDFLNHLSITTQTGSSLIQSINSKHGVSLQNDLLVAHLIPNFTARQAAITSAVVASTTKGTGADKPANTAPSSLRATTPTPMIFDDEMS